MSDITAHFLADFKQFKEAVDGAALHLRSFQSDATKVAASLARVGDSFSGKRVLQEATLMVKAVTELGGVTKLTATEQTRLNATLTEAIAKYGALGKEAGTVSEEMLAMAKASEQAQKPVEGLTATISTWAAAKAVAGGQLLADTIEHLGAKALNAVEALPRLVESTIKLGNELYTMSLRTGISVEGLSKLRYAAAQTGLDLSQLTGAIFKMEANLGKTGKAGEDMTAMIKHLGLDAAELRGAKPEEAVVALLDALAKVPTQARMSAEGTELFGKSFRQIQGLVHEDVAKIMADAERLGIVMNTNMAAMSRVADDHMTKLRFQLEAVGNQIGAVFIPIAIGLADALSQGLTAAVQAAGAALAKLGGSGGLLGTVAVAFGEGDAAIAAQIKLYEALRDVIILVVKYGLAPLLQAFGSVSDRLASDSEDWDRLQKTIAWLVLGFDKLYLATLKWSGASKSLIDQQQSAVNAALADYNTKVTELMEHQSRSPTAGRDAATAMIAGIDAGLDKLKTSGVDIGKIFADVKAKATELAKGIKTDFDDLGGGGEDKSARGTFLKSLIDNSHKLAIEMQAARAGGASLTEVTEQYGKQAYELAQKLRGLGADVDDEVRRFASLYITMQKAKEEAKLVAEALKSFEDAKKLERAPSTITSPIGDTSQLDRELASLKAVTDVEAAIVKAGLADQNAARKAALELQLALDKKRGASTARLFADEEALAKEMTRVQLQAEDERYAAAVVAAGADTLLLEQLARQHEQNQAHITANAAREGKIRVANEKSGNQQMLESLQGLSKAFSELAQIGGDAFKGIAKEVGTLISAMALGKQAGMDFKAAMDQMAAARQKVNDANNDGSDEKATGKYAQETQALAAMAQAAIAAAAAIGQVTAKGSTMSRTLKGAAVGAEIGSAAGLPGAAIGAIVGGIVGFARGKTSASEQALAGRAASEAFTQSLKGQLDWMQQIEVHQAIAAGASENWATQMVGVRDAYLKAGLGADAAQDAVNRLFAAEAQGGPAAQKVIDEIVTAMHTLDDEAHKTAKEIDDLAASFDGTQIFHEAQVAVGAFQKIGGATHLTTEETQRLHEMVQKAIDKYHVMGIEVPADLQAVADATAVVTDGTEALMDSISGAEAFKEADTWVKAVNKLGGINMLTTAEQKRLLDILQTAIDKYHVLGKAVPSDIAAMAQALKDAITQSDGLAAGLDAVTRSAGGAVSEAERLRKAADDAFTAWARTYNYIAAGGSTVDATKGALSPENYASFEDWMRAYIQFNTDSAGHMPSHAMIAAAWRSNSIRPPWARDAEQKGYALGTGGRYLNFGSGTLTTLHGLERVSTAAEGRAEATAWMAMEGRLASIERLLKAQPLQLRDAVMIAAGSR